jgi:PAS domain S-box-containing protein
VNNVLKHIETRWTLLCGAGAGLLGLGGVAGWMLHAPVLLQLAAGNAAMQFNTAIGLVIAGLGLSLIERRPRAAAVCGVLSAALGGATLIEYGLRINLGIDALLYQPWLAAEVPARMAVNTAVCFLITGFALACASLLPRVSGMCALFGGYCVLIIAGSALTGYGLGIEIAYRWAYQTRMAILTAAAFVFLGAGLFKVGWRRVTVNRTLWLTLLTAGGVAGTSALTWVAVETAYRKMGAPQSVPDLMLFTGITRACVAAIFVFLWRNSRERLVKVEVLNTNLQDKVAERTAQLHAIFEAVRVGTWSHDLVSNCTANQGRTQEIFGFPPGPAEHSFEELLQAIHPEDRPKLREASQRAVEHGDGIDLEFRVQWPDQTVHWVLAQGGVSKYTAGKPACLSGINLDITRLKTAESALQASEASVRKLNQELERRIRIQSKELVESEKRFRLMVEGLRDYAFFMLDTSGKVVSWNLGAERIHGYRAEEIIGKHFSILCTKEDTQLGRPDEELQIAAEQGRFEESGWRARRDGGRFWAHVLLTAVHDEAGDLCAFSQITRDITERRRTQEAVEEQRKRAEEANHAKSRFLASMSHEIRTPMNAILGMTDLLWDTELNEDQRHYVEIFRRAGSTLMELINDILDLSKIESGRLVLEKSEFDVETVVADVVELLAPKAHDKAIGLRSWLAPAVTKRVTGDAARLRQVLVNLVGNAIKFTGSGEVVISVERREQSAAGELTFAVSDTGIGIPKDKLATIFEAFEQVDASTARKYGGTGLGLPISQRLVECMGGVLRVDSEPGRGSTFHFTAKFEPAGGNTEGVRKNGAPLPIQTSPLKAANPLPPAPKPIAARILIAEDSLDNQFLLQAYLKGGPYAVSFVADGRAAVKEFQEGAFDLVLMDMQMPIMDGLTATRAIREIENRQGRRAVPIAALTANAHREAIQTCLSAGCTSHLSKPISKAGLLRAVEELLASAAASAPAPAPPPVTANETPAPAPQVVQVAVPALVAVPEGLEALAPRYLSARRKELPEIVALLAASDFEQICSRGHNMKGTGRSYGFPDLTEIGASLERSAKHRDKEAIDKQLMRLSNYLESVRVPGEEEHHANPV